MPINTCQYSFLDLFKAANFNKKTSILNQMTQQEINDLVKKLCKLANWGWEDRLGTDNIIYTAFSPEIKN
jgi:hypothetical protein